MISREEDAQELNNGLGTEATADHIGVRYLSIDTTSYNDDDFE